MKTRYKILISAIPVFTIGLFYLYVTANGYSSYNEGVGLTRFSDDEFQKYVQKANGVKNLTIIHLNDDDLSKIPVIKELIAKSWKQDFPLNRVGILNATLDEIKFNHEYIAQKYSVKYNQNPSSYFSTRPASDRQLENHPDSYWYEYDGRFFKYSGKFYSFYDNQILVNYGEPYHIEIGVLKHDLDSDRFYVELTDEDWQYIPKVKETIDKIGTLQEDIQVQVGLPSSDVNKYRQWMENNSMMIPNSFLEYEGEYYKISYWIA